MPDDHSEVVPLLPIPNRTVKRLCADDSADSRVKVGHRQALTARKAQQKCWAFCFVARAIDSDELLDPSPCSVPRFPLFEAIGSVHPFAAFRRSEATRLRGAPRRNAPGRPPIDRSRRATTIWKTTG